MTTDNQETGPDTIEAILDAQFSEPDVPTDEQEESSPNEETQDEALEAASETEEETEIDETTDLEPETETPQHLNLEEYGDLTVPVVIDGVETATSLREMVKRHQLQADSTRKTMALADDRRSMEAEFAQRDAKFADQQRLLDEQLAQNIEREPDWVTMAEEKPLEYLAEREKWNQKQAQRQHAQHNLQQSQAAQSQQFQQMTAELAVQAMPEWASDVEFAKNANGRMTVALEAGFTEAEYNGSVDYRLAVLLEKASRYDASLTSNAAVEKKLSLAPKVLKPRGSKGKADVQVERKTAINRKLDRAHSMESHLDAFMEGRG